MKTWNLLAGIMAILVLCGPALGQSGWTDDGTVVRLTTSTDKVGIGTNSPITTAHIEFPKRTAVGDNTKGLRLKNTESARSWLLTVGTSDTEHSDFVIRDVVSGLQSFVIRAYYGNVGIGTTSPQSKLAVNGTITAKEVEVTLTGWPDHVFADGYRLMPLREVAAYIHTNRRLPDMPSAAEVAENGVSLGDMQAKLLQKVEELTLYVIDLKKENEALKARVAAVEKQ